MGRPDVETFSQSATNPEFVQDPYPFYEQTRGERGALFHWQEYGMPCATSYAAVWAILRDRRFGREVPADKFTAPPPHQAEFWKVEDHSLLQLEPPGHTRLRGLILRAFTSRKINALAPEIETLSHQLIDGFEGSQFDLLAEFGEKLPVIIIARFLGIPETDADKLLAWSHAMVGMYQAGRTAADEVAAATAAAEFSEYLNDYIAFRRDKPADDLITSLIQAEELGEKLSTAELISTCILLLNAGHEATVHTIGNGVKALLETGTSVQMLGPDNIDTTVEEILRYDPPLHMFTRWVYEDVEIGRQTLRAGTEVGCLLAAANRDPARWDCPEQFDPTRPIQTNTSFGAGVHFCIGAPLARLELKIALPILFDRCPKLRITETPEYANNYHFHGLTKLVVTR